MAGQTTPEQEAAAKADADRIAAEKKAAEEKAAADKAAADKAAADAAAATAEKPKPKGYIVKGAAVVLRSDDGAERYLYRGAPVDDSAFSKESVKHAVSVGLIEKAK
jgi:transcription elongation GreA/GreB family factor